MTNDMRQQTLWPSRDVRYPAPPSTPEPHSLAAAAAILPVVGTRRAIVLQAIQDHGPIAEWQLEALLGWPGNTIRPRIWELIQVGLIERQGTIPTPSGRTSWLYVPVDDDE